MLAFEISEYEERIQKVKARMDAEGIEVLLVTDPANMNYLSGYDGWSFYVPQVLVLIAEERQPIWIGRGIDANGARHTTWLDDAHIISYPDDYVQSPVKHPMDFVSDILKQIGQSKRRIGLEMDAYYFTALGYEKLKRGLPDATFKDATLLVNWVRIVKSEREIQYMKRAAEIAEKAMWKGVDSIDEGVRECDVAANIYHSLVSGTELIGGDYPSIVPMMPTGVKSNAPHMTWSEDRFKKGDPVVIELAGCYRRYHSPLARTVSIGPPHPKLKELAAVAVEGLNAALETVAPGVACEEVERAWTKTISQYGYMKDSRIGYAMGLNYPPDWGEHTASIRYGDRTVLEPNMTFHMIPGIWLDDHCGVEISESFRVTENGCEVLARFPRELIVVPRLHSAIS